MIDLDAIWRDVLRGAPLLAERPDFRFDPHYYTQTNPQAPTDPEEMREHFLREGKGAGLFPTRYQQLRAQHPDIVWRIKRLATDERLVSALRETRRGATELAFELMRAGHDAKISNFAGTHYLDANPDVAAAGMDPLEHYLIHGMRERRPNLSRVRNGQYVGLRKYDPDLPTCLIAVHEFSNTGAPHVGLDLARDAAQTHNVLVAALRGGPLLDAMRETSCAVVVTPNPYADFGFLTGEVFERIDTAVCNSVESYPFVRMLVARGVPFAAYVHEYAWYTFPTYKTIHMALYADLLVFSSEHVRDSWGPVLQDVEFDRDRDLTIIPQRPMSVGSVDEEERDRARRHLSSLIDLDCTGRRIVCGAGHAQWRKGTDIFVMTAQIARHRDPDTLFVWVGDGLNFEDTNFGAWMSHHLHQAGAGDSTGNLFMLPAGDHYRDVLIASDAMLLSSRLDPLPNVVFDALDVGCHVVLFEGASGFTDPVYAPSEHFHRVEYANPEAAASVLLGLPPKTVVPPEPGVEAPRRLFAQITAEVGHRLRSRRRFAIGASPLDVPVLYSSADREQGYRAREREKLFTLGRRYVWRHADDARNALAVSSNWVHETCEVVDYDEVGVDALPEFSLHLHAYYVDDLPAELREHAVYRAAKRIIVTTDSTDKRVRVEEAMAAFDLPAEVLVVPNRGRDILPFLELFRSGGPAAANELWGHIHQKRSVGSTAGGDVWRTFMTSILLGTAERASVALALMQRPDVGLVAAFDPFYGQWNASRALLPTVQEKLSGPLPPNPMVYPMGNMFWVRGQVVEAMNTLFSEDHAWPNEPIPNDGTEFHLIERLWPVMAAETGLRSVFVSKPDQPRRL